LGESENSLATLTKLSEAYPTSPHYAEAQFRIGESAFMTGDYITAEDAYSEAIFTSVGDVFYERSLFKRGWSRYKQGLYIEAADDYMAALKIHNFEDYEHLSRSEKDQFDEYFRAIGLAFANLESAEPLQNYFSDEADFQYLYHTYTVISNIYVKQERYSDAVATLEQFISANPNSPKVPLAQLGSLNIWKVGGFRSRFQSALESFYTAYHPKSRYWSERENSAEQKPVFDALREYSLLVAAFYQETYYQEAKQKNKAKEAFTQANSWYQRYLEHYAAYARQDKIYNLYAELLSAENQLEEALGYFELAAYDGDIVLNKEAAYATIDISHKLHQQQPSTPLWLDKHIHYSLTSAQLYPNDSRYHGVALHAAELAFTNERYSDVITLTNTLSDNAAAQLLYSASTIKAQAYVKLEEYQQAETIFSDLLTQKLTRAEQRKQQDNLALTIYQQAELQLKRQEPEQAIQNFARVAQQVPSSDIAPTSLYEAIALSMKYEQWDNAITYIQQFQQLYPKNALYNDASRQLSTAYLNAGEGIKAAQAFEQISAQEDNQEIKMAALWQAAELYESKNNTDAAIRSYRTYANSYTRPYPQYMEAMYKLTQLYGKTNEQDKVFFWQQKIANSDKQASRNLKNDRTNFIASSVMLELARDTHSKFTRRTLVEPLADNLRIKKKLMQDAIALYGQASAYSYANITTESTYAIGNIYQEFSSALLTSERPRHLNGEELEQYDILIEDQAFPFEEKAIEFYEINLARIKAEGTNNEWISQSYTQLATLFPVRYSRKGKLDIYQDAND
jgi:tetratricopeptide (TPR) repeat protein